MHIFERAHTCVQPVNIKVAQIPRDNPAHLKADLSRWEDRATFRPFLSTRAGQQTNDREEDHDTDNREMEALQGFKTSIVFFFFPTMPSKGKRQLGQKL